MKERVPIKNKIGAFLIIALSGFVLKLTYLFASRIWRVDLYYYIDAAKTMLSGGVLYRDFGCSHPPLGYFEFYWMARLFGYDNMYLTIKIGALVIQTLTAYIVYLIFTRIDDSKTGLVRALLFLALISLSTDFWPHNIPLTYMLPAFAGIWCIAKDDFNPGARSLFLFGLFISCATLISTNVVFYSLLVPFLTIKNRGFKIKAVVTEGMIAFAGFVIPIVLVFAYFASHHALADWYFWNIGWASIYSGFKPWYTKIFSFFYGFIKTWQWLPFVVLAGYACYVIIRRKKYSTDAYAYFVLAVFFCACASKYPMNKPHPRYYLYLLPGLLFAIDYGLKLITEKRRKIIYAGLFLFVILTLIETNISAWRHPYDEGFALRSNLKSWIWNNVPPEKTIWVWDEGYEIYYETKRAKSRNSFFSAGEFLDKAKLWRANGYKHIDRMWERFLRELAANPPDYIIDLTLDFEESNRDRRDGLHKMYYDRFYSFVREGYRIRAVVDGRYRVLERK